MRREKFVKARLKVEPGRSPRLSIDFREVFPQEQRHGQRCRGWVSIFRGSCSSLNIL
jgi:hypothetical protein